MPKFTPNPRWRHITPWWLVYWINDHFPTCWTNMFLWKEFGEECSWWPSPICFHPYDYCNKFPTKEEQQKVL